MALPKPQRVTTTGSMRNGGGQMCQRCKERVRLVRWVDGTGYVCPPCDPSSKPWLIEVVEDDPPAQG